MDLISCVVTEKNKKKVENSVDHAILNNLNIYFRFTHSEVNLIQRILFVLPDYYYWYKTFIKTRDRGELKCFFCYRILVSCVCKEPFMGCDVQIWQIWWITYTHQSFNLQQFMQLWWCSLKWNVFLTKILSMLIKCGQNCFALGWLSFFCYVQLLYILKLEKFIWNY